MHILYAHSNAQTTVSPCDSDYVSKSASSLQETRVSEQGRLPAATCGECCHHYSNVLQISYFQLIPNIAGYRTLNQGRDNMTKGNKRKTSKG